MQKVAILFLSTVDKALDIFVLVIYFNQACYLCFVQSALYKNLHFGLTAQGKNDKTLKPTEEITRTQQIV